MSLETLLVVVLFFFLPPLVSAIGPWLRKRMQEMEQSFEEEAESRRREIPAAPVLPALPRRPAPAPESPPVHVRPAQPPAPPARTARTATLPGLRDQGEQRRSIVLMTVLGPCRALDPY